MSFKHLLVHLDSTPRAAERLGVAVTLARRFQARLTGLFAEATQLGPAVPALRDPTAVRAAAAQTREVFEAQVKAAGVASEWWPLEAVSQAEVLELATTCVRYTDLAIVGQPSEASERTPRELVEHLLLGSGRPLVVVPSVGRFADVGRRVVIGWSANRGSARALNDALPFLTTAESVHVVSFVRGERKPDSAVPPLSVFAHLEAHGVSAKRDLVVHEREGVSVVETLLNHSFDLQADLTVLGARIDTFPLPRASGSTRDILTSMGTPVLLSY